MDKQIGQAIGKFLKDYRFKSGLSSEDVIKHVGIESVDLLEDYENGNVQIPLPRIYGLANIYEIPADQIIELFYKLSQDAVDFETKSQTAAGRI